MFKSECVSDCPSGWLSNYEANECYPLTDLDVKLIPFPCLIVMVILFFLSYVGSKQKRKHLLVPSWLVLMGILEHGCIISQIILNFKFGTWRYGAFLILAYAAFLATNISFVYCHKNKIVQKDRLYKSWRNQRSNLCARRMMNVFGLLGNWKSYKLSYAAFWGIKLRPAPFTHP